MNRRTALRSLGGLALSLASVSGGCLEAPAGPSPTAPSDGPPDERVEWASIGLQRVAVESLAEDDVRVTATVEIRNPTEYRVPVNAVRYAVLSGRGESFEAFASAEVRGCDFVELLGANRTYLDFVREEGLPCPAEKTPAFVVEPRDTTEISAVANPRTDAERAVAAQLVGASDPVYVRVDGEAMLWNRAVDVDFEIETETALTLP